MVKEPFYEFLNIPLIQRERRGHSGEIIERIGKLYSNNTIRIKYFIPRNEDEQLTFWTDALLRGKSGTDYNNLLNELISNNCIEAMKFIDTFMSMVHESLPFNPTNNNADDNIIHESYYKTPYKVYCKFFCSNIFVTTRKDTEPKHHIVILYCLALNKDTDFVTCANNIILGKPNNQT